MPIIAQGTPGTLDAVVGTPLGVAADFDALPVPTVTVQALGGGAVQAGFPASPLVHDGLGLYHYVWNVPLAQPIATYDVHFQGNVGGVAYDGWDTVEVVAAGSIPSGGFVSEADVRDYMELNGVSSLSKYSSAGICSNIRAASTTLEMLTHRFFADRPAATYVFTSEGRAQFFIPGIRNVTSVTWQGAPMTFAVPPSNNGACWFLPDIQQSGIYTGFQLRVFRSEGMGNYLANPNWFDQAADSPFHPANRGGGVNQHTLPNDVAILGDWGYADTSLPEPLLLATKVLASWYTIRPASLLANISLSPQGVVSNYGELPPEVVDFVREWRIGEQAVMIQ